MSRIEQHQVSRPRNHGILVVPGLLLAVVIFAAPLALADEAPPTNLDLMSDLTTQVVNELLERFSGELSGRSVRLQPHVNNEQYLFMTNVFTIALTDRGITTYQPGSSESNSDAVVLKYQATSFNLSYPKVYRSYLIGGKRVRRRADVTLLATLIADSSGAVAGVGEASRDHEDQFGYGDLARVEEGNYPFARPPLPDSGWGKYAEPVLVTGIIVGLIYLFFSNQSDS